jgi:hypothetical protein
VTGYKRGYMYAPEEPERPDDEVEGGWPSIIFYLVFTVVCVAVVAAVFGFAYAALTSDGDDPPPQKVEEIVKWPKMQGDDNHDGHIDETESGWSCETMGDLKCGPNEHKMRLS